MTTRIVQLSDSHISLQHPQRTVDLEKCIEAINQLHPQPDLVVHSGDITHDGHAEEYQTARHLLDKLDAPYIVLIGNRDNRKVLMKAFADNSCVQADGEFLQYSVDNLAVRLLVLDTFSENSNKGQLCEARLDHLKAMLDADTVKPTAIFMHHPPFEASEIPDPFQFENWNDVDELSALLTRHSSLCGVFCGHVHRNIDAEIAGVNASAISCIAADLRKGDVSDASRATPIFKMISFPAVEAVVGRGVQPAIGKLYAG